MADTLHLEIVTAGGARVSSVTICIASAGRSSVCSTKKARQPF